VLTPGLAAVTNKHTNTALLITDVKSFIAIALEFLKAL
jgi:hypothetical protein